MPPKYLGRDPNATDAQVSDTVQTFIEHGQPMVRGRIRANYPLGYGYRDLDLSAEQAEALGMALIQAAGRSRDEAVAVRRAAIA